MNNVRTCIIISYAHECRLFIPYIRLFLRGAYFANFEIAAIHGINFRKINRKPHSCTQRINFMGTIFSEIFISRNSRIHPSKITRYMVLAAPM